jgi:tetratricopeptide (TPR) repeat protein
VTTRISDGPDERMTAEELTKHAEHARQLEEDAARYPGDRGEILLEAAQVWNRAGDHRRAMDLLSQVIEAGGEDGAFARVVLAEVLLDVGRTDDAYDQLGALKASRPSSPGPYQLAGELLEERGDARGALDWFNMAVSRLDEQELAALRREFGWATYAATVVNGWRRVRETLGLPPDELDRAAPQPPGRFGLGGFPTADDLLAAHEDRQIRAREVRTLFWQQPELHAATTRWPEVFGDGDDPTEYHRSMETRFREMAERGVAQRITLVPGTVDGLERFASRWGGDVADEMTRRAYLDEAAGAGRRIAWPPPRNASCWCGSGSKYKKCCGSPVNR